MDLPEAERCCCVVTLSKAFSSKKSVSCSGVIVHPQSGTIICTGLPFSRFTANKKSLNTNGRVLPAHRFSKKLKIRITFSPQVDMNQCAHANYAENHHILSSQRETSADLLMLVNCMEFRQAFQAVFPEAHQWRFYGDEDEEEELLKDAQFLSWFAVLKAKDLPLPNAYEHLIPWQDSQSLLKGCPVVACGTPFGSLCLDLFTSTLSRGIVSNLTGQENAIILTDARCLPGTEGGGLFALKSSEKVRLIGLVVSPFGWKANEWIGLSLVCSVHLIFKHVIQCARPESPLQELRLREKKLCMSTTAEESSLVRHPTVCLVDSGQFWGSGVMVTPELVLTCRHVVNGKATVMLKFHQNHRFADVRGDVLFSTEESSPFDLAVVKLRGVVEEAVVPQMSQCFHTGEPVVVVGFGAMGRGCGPSLTSGVLSKSIRAKEQQQQQPVMLQTTCAVQAGTSGGAVVRPHSGELLGIVSSNTKDFATNVTYPHLNFSVPVSVFQQMLEIFHQTNDVSVFKGLDSADEDVRRVWRLQIPASKL